MDLESSVTQPQSLSPEAPSFDVANHRSSSRDHMDFTVQLPISPLSRRRLQNRIAQRKFRQKRDQTQQAASADVPKNSHGSPTAPVSLSSSSSLMAPIDMGNQLDFLAPMMHHLQAADALSLEPSPDVFATDNGLMQLSLGPTGCHPAVVSSGSTAAVLDVAAAALTLPSSSSATATDAAASIDSTESFTPWLDDDLNPAPYELAKPPDVGSIGSLHIAAQRGNDRILRELLRHQDNVNEKDSDGRTALMHAAMYDHVNVVQTLLAHGARIGDVDYENRTTLHWAVLYRRHSILEVLLDHCEKNNHECNVNACDNAGWTALHMAIDRGFEAGVHMLLRRGANVHSKAHKCPYAKKPHPAPAG